MSTRTYYEILNVTTEADGETIKKSYRKLAMQYHPDKNPGDKTAEEKFKEAAEAYGVLSDPEKRARYDRFGHDAFVGRGGGGGQGFSSAEDIFQNFGDIFSDFFGMGGQQNRRPNGPRRGSDLRYISEITLKDVLNGLEREIEFDAEESCDECTGSGAEKGTKPLTCSTCGGSGQVVRAQGFFTMASPCPSCQGRGQVIKNPCRKCKGAGRVEKHRKIRISVPPGVDTGTRLRVTGEGEGGYFGAPAGDLYVEIRVKAHDHFQRRGEDLVAELSVPYVQLLLGAEIPVPTLAGESKLKLQRGTQPDDTVKLRGEGLPSLRGQRRGDIYYQIRVQFPDQISKEEEKHLLEISKLYGFDAAAAKEEGKGGLFGRKK